jgi:RimJ/RimL family protein N-acetyltransferase
VGARAALLPVPDGLAAAVLDGAGIDAALAAAGLRAAAGWPHDDTADALGGGDASRTWLVVVDGEVVGECGWKGWPDDTGTVEVGYGLAAPSRGRGLGTEAVGVLVAWSETQPSVHCVAAEVLPGNEASLRLLRRLGFTERPVEGRWVRAERGRPRVRGRHVC